MAKESEEERGRKRQKISIIAVDDDNSPSNVFGKSVEVEEEGGKEEEEEENEGEDGEEEEIDGSNKAGEREKGVAPPVLGKSKGLGEILMGKGKKMKVKENKKKENKKKRTWTRRAHTNPDDEVELKAVREDGMRMLKSYLEQCNGRLGAGWTVDAIKGGTGRIDKFFISPEKQRFRSMIAVARALGLSGMTRPGFKNRAVGLSGKKRPGFKNRAVGLSGKKRPGFKNRALGLSGKKRPGFENKAYDDNPRFAGTMNNDSQNLLERSDIHPSEFGNLNGGGMSFLGAGESVQCNNATQDEVTLYSRMNMNENLEKRSKKSNEKAAFRNEKGIVEAPKGVVVVSEQVSQHCEDVLRKIVSADEFGALSSMVQGIISSSGEKGCAYKSPVATSSVLDLHLIGMRMMTGAYGEKPELFLTDIRQVWSKVNSVGNELINLASFLTKFSEGLYEKQVRSLYTKEQDDDNDDDDANNDNNDDDSGVPPLSKDVEEPPMSVIKEVHPLEKSTTIKTTTATTCGIKSSKKPSPTSSISFFPSSPTQTRGKETRKIFLPLQPEQSSENLGLTTQKEFVEEVLRIPTNCKICAASCDPGKGTTITCDACSNIFHTSCLKCIEEEREKVKVPSKVTWYCPSCLCRKCLTDVDDEMIVLCDLCDEGYHIYCLTPPLETIPQGSWYCQTCSSQNKLPTTTRESSPPSPSPRKRNPSGIVKNKPKLGRRNNNIKHVINGAIQKKRKYTKSRR